MDKKELRAQIRAKKRAMTTAQVEACSEKLAELFRAHPLYKAAKSIYGYMPYNQEVRTIPIMAAGAGGRKARGRAEGVWRHDEISLAGRFRRRRARRV